MDNSSFNQEYKNTYNQYIKIGELFQKDFQFYIKTHSKILEQITKKTTEPPANVFQEIQKIVFQEEFCKESELEKKKNNFLKTFFEMEKIRQTNKQLDLMEDAVDLCQKAGKIIQKHWEFYQYKKDKLSFDDIFSLFFEEVEEVLFLWDSFLIKLEIFSKILVLNEKQATKEKEGQKSLQVGFLKISSQAVDLNSIENFVLLLKKIKELLTEIKHLEIDLQVASVQIQPQQIVVQILLPTSISINFQNIVTQLHADKLQRDGLQKILINTFGADSIRNIEKKIIMNFQKQIKNLITSIQKEGNFIANDKTSQEVSVKVFALLEKMKQLRQDTRNGTRNYKRFSKDFLPFTNTPAVTSKTLPSKDMNPNTNQQLSKGKSSSTEHIAFLTS